MPFILPVSIAPGADNIKPQQPPKTEAKTSSFLSNLLEKVLLVNAHLLPFVI